MELNKYHPKDLLVLLKTLTDAFDNVDLASYMQDAASLAMWIDQTQLALKDAMFERDQTTLPPIDTL